MTRDPVPPTAAHGELIAPGTLRFRRELAAPVQTVWAHLTDPDLRARWLAGGAMDLRPGGVAEFVFDNSRLADPDDPAPPKHAAHAGEVRFTGEVLAAEPPHRLVLRWPQHDGSATEVTIELEARGDRTLLTLTETGLDAREFLLGTAAGWHTCLDILAAILVGERPPSFWSRHTRTEAEYGERLG